MQCLMLRFDAPLMSFGGVLVDQHNPTERFPGRAMLTGLLANALGWHHRDAQALNDLQSRLIYAARWDVNPTALRDYQTADLGQPHLSHPGWTTRGTTEYREGGDARKGTHQRYRHYWANGVLTLALALQPGEPRLEAISQALEKPARPLFIGRKPCLPAARIVLGLREAADVLDALRREPLERRAGGETQRVEACWPPGCADPTIEARQKQHRTDDRDWRMQAHMGQRPIIVGQIEVPPCT